MMLLHSNYYNTNERADIARLSRIYKLYRKGLFKTCRYDEAIRLLKTGEWFDKTNYLPKEEVLSYEEPRQRLCSHQSEASSERQEPGHQQYQPNHESDAGEKYLRQENGSRPTNGEVRKRGRARGIKNGSRFENS